MKKILFLILPLIFPPFGGIEGVFAQADVSDNISIVFKSGNASEIVKYFDASIDLSIPGSEGIYSKSQSELILKNFFSSHVSQSFSVLHKGNSKDGSKYMIGNLTTNRGVFRTYIYMKNQSGKFYIHQLRIDTEEKE